MKRKSLRGVLMTALAMLMAFASGGAVMALSSGPPANSPIVPPINTGDQPSSGSTELSTNCRSSFTNGVGTNEFSYCFSDDGTIAMLQHSQFLEHLDIGFLTEGWCISAGSSVRGATFGSNPNTGLEAPTYPHPTKVRHHTTDGDLRVESRFSWSPGNKQIVIKMNVRNLSDAPLTDVFLTRFADADMSNTAANDEWTSTGFRSVAATEPGQQSLQLFAKTADFDANAMIYPNANPVLGSFCYDTGSDNTLSAPGGDRSMGVLYQLGTIAPGETKTVQYIYRVAS